MILYYSATKKTKVFAEALSDVLSLPVYELKAKLGQKINFSFIIQSLFFSITGKPYPVDNMPADMDSKEIYLCMPVWAGRLASPGLYFMHHADLKGRIVHLLLTCDSITKQETYKKNALDLLEKTDCIPGRVYVFATGKNPCDKNTIMEQLRDILEP